ncbi:fatty-acid amide hydrolase [Elysia marginata]|uniref:Fatty-acid amide hydrolase n=1 Tax=Elysia marginata TaxID=1093978 RepID=A0AAV4I0M5_9GAST|nr:fatty-acid amide hydrolase [Elysia marginata]
MRGKTNQKIQRRAQRSREDIEEMKDDLAKNATIIDESIVQLSFRDLQKGLQYGDISATAALRSYQAKALEVNGEVNAITDILQDAKGIANELDSLPSSERGPLHGKPISLKESCGIKGLDCTAGFGELIGVQREEDTVLVEVLKSKGAVPFIRTSSKRVHQFGPQGLFILYIL